MTRRPRPVDPPPPPGAPRRPVVVRERAVRQRARQNRTATREWYHHLRASSYAERFRVAFSLVPGLITVGTLALLALALLAAAVSLGYVTIQ